jgi:hypothetical protein
MWSIGTIPIGFPPLKSAWISPHKGRAMLEWVSRDRNYNPKIVAAMTSAFDTVFRSLLAKENDSDDIRRKLALIILHHTDRGERDLSFRELMG